MTEPREDQFKDLRTSAQRFKAESWINHDRQQKGETGIDLALRKALMEIASGVALTAVYGQSNREPYCISGWLQQLANRDNDFTGSVRSAYPRKAVLRLEPIEIVIGLDYVVAGTYLHETEAIV